MCLSGNAEMESAASTTTMVYATRKYPERHLRSPIASPISASASSRRDAGVGYTYLDPQTGHELLRRRRPDLQLHQPRPAVPERHRLSISTGAASRFVSNPHVRMIGLAGYLLPADSPATAAPAPRSAPFRGTRARPRSADRLPLPRRRRLSGLPLNLKAYKDFAAENRPKATLRG